MYKTCTIDGKALKRLYINGRLVYCTDPDQMVIANTLAMSGDFGSKVEIGSNSYTYNGQTYNYKVYQMPTTPKWSPMGAGNDNPWMATPKIAVCAAHWASSLKTGTWTGSGGLTYNIPSWTNLRTWALANGFTEDDLRGMTDIGDVVVAVCGSRTTALSQSECPWFMSKELVKKAFWNGSMRGTLGYHTPQKSIEQSGGFSEWEYGALTTSDSEDWFWIYEEPEYSNGVWTTEITNGPDFVTMTATGPEDATSLSFTGSGEGITASGSATRTALSGDMKLLAPVVMQGDYSWQIPKVGYDAIPSRDSTTKNTAQSYDNTYLAYVGDSGKPTFVKIDQYDVIASQCHSQFAGPDFSACLPVLNAYAQANNQTLNILTEEMLPS